MWFKGKSTILKDLDNVLGKFSEANAQLTTKLQTSKTKVLSKTEVSRKGDIGYDESFCWVTPDNPCGNCFGCYLDFFQRDPIYSRSRERQDTARDTKYAGR